MIAKIRQIRWSLVLVIIHQHESARLGKPTLLCEDANWGVIERRLLFVVLLTRACWPHRVKALPLTSSKKTREQQPLCIKQATGLIENCVCPCFD